MQLFLPPKETESSPNDESEYCEARADARRASFHALGETPERDAWKKRRAWAKPKGLLDDSDKHPIFGFNSPNPSNERKEYGYEFWIGAGPEI